MNKNDVWAMFDMDEDISKKTIVKKHLIETKSENDTSKQPVDMKNILKKLGKSSIQELMPVTKMVYTYPQQKFVYKRPTKSSLRPYTDSWVHDEQQINDQLTEENMRVSKILSQLLTIEYPPQRSPKWYELRESNITASEVGCILGDNQHEPLYKFYLKKLTKIPFEPSIACYHGTKLEQIATMVYEYRMNVQVEELGLVKHQKYDFLAASPDGIIGKHKLDNQHKTKYVGRMLEVKCPLFRKLNDSDPFYNIKYYYDQIQLQMECCDLEECDFWQNTIKEYNSREEFIEDTNIDEPFRSIETGMEKGCLIQLLPKDKIGDYVNYEKNVCEFSKFLYPPKIDMSPFECDIWIAQSLNNLETTLIEKIITKNDRIRNIITNSIEQHNSTFLDFMVEERDKFINEEIDKNNWKLLKKPHVYVTKVKESIQRDAIEKFKNIYYIDFAKKLMYPADNKNFIKFLIHVNIPDKYKDIVNDPELIRKIQDLNAYKDFNSLLEQESELNFIKQLVDLITKLELPAKYTYDKVYYWKVEKTLCTTVKRDRKWFSDHLPLLIHTWEQLKFLRKNNDKAQKLFMYIENLPTQEEHYGKVIKNNALIMNFIDSICVQ